MEAVIGLLLMILGVSHGVETYCDGRQDGAQCYGAFGGTVVIQLMDNASDIFTYQLSSKTKTILNGRKNLILSNLIENRSFFNPGNGTFKITNLSWNDGGEYKIEIFDSEGRRTEHRTLQLMIQGVETYCDGRQDKAQCYGALGGTVVVQLMDNASDIPTYRWFKRSERILHGRKTQIVENLIRNRSVFTPSNGTFRINELSRTDGDEYELQIFDSEGEKAENRTLQLTIQAGVSSVLLVPECLSQGQMKVSCSSEGGESLQYSWTLDGRTLRDTELLSRDTEMNSITLKQNVSGQLVCSVKNNVSRMSTCGFTLIKCTISNEMHLSQWVLAGNNSLCESTAASTTITVTEASTADHSLLICGVRAVVVIIALIGITVYFAWKKNKYKMAVRRQMEQENTVMMVEMRGSEF